MAEPEYRLAGAALQLGRFTAVELARAAGTNPHTTRTWLQRHDRFVEPDLTPAPVAVTNGKGRPRKAWRLREGAAHALRQSLDQLFPLHFDLPRGDLRRAGQLRHLDEIEIHLKARERAGRLGYVEQMNVEDVAARSWVRIAWEDFATLDSQAQAVAQPMLEHLAALECQLGVGGIVAAESLPEVAGWAAQRLNNMSKRGATVTFAARAMRARVEVRTPRDRARLSAAAVAAPVWADEGMAEQAGVAEATMRNCRLIAEAVPPATLLRELDAAVDRRPSYGMCPDPTQAQAVVLGLAELHITTRNIAMRDWLGFRSSSNDWIIELAPAVLYGLAEAESAHWRRLFDPLEHALRQASDLAKGWGWTPGRLRCAALAYTDQAIKRTVQVEADPSAIIASYGRVGA